MQQGVEGLSLSYDRSPVYMCMVACQDWVRWDRMCRICLRVVSVVLYICMVCF